MIVRVLTVTVRPGKVGVFNVLFRRQLTLLREQPGLLYVKLARRLDPLGGEEAVLFEEWQDAASLYTWVGSNLAEPRLIDGIRELSDGVSVAHYEALDSDDQSDGDGGLGPAEPVSETQGGEIGQASSA
jgi:heme-degrading monooxygenase HmoA